MCEAPGKLPTKRDVERGIDVTGRTLEALGVRDVTDVGGALGGGGASGINEAPEMLASEQAVAAEAAKTAARIAEEEERKRVETWQGEGRTRGGRAATLLTGPRGLLNDGTTARRTLLAM